MPSTPAGSGGGAGGAGGAGCTSCAGGPGCSTVGAPGGDGGSSGGADFKLSSRCGGGGSRGGGGTKGGGGGTVNLMENRQAFMWLPTNRYVNTFLLTDELPHFLACHKPSTSYSPLGTGLHSAAFLL